MKPSSIQIRLDVPSTPQSVSTARLFIAAAARHFGYSDDTVEDIKLAISEAVTNAIQNGQNGRVAVAVGADESIVRFDVSHRTGFQPEKQSGPEFNDDSSADAFTVIEALFPGATIEPSGSTNDTTVMQFFAERPPFKDPEDQQR